MEKHYKLKTDLPTFKAGDLFYLDQNGSLRHKEKDIVAYHYSTLAKFPEALEKFWEPAEEECKRWRAEDGEPYFYVNHDAEVLPSREDLCPVDNDRHRLGNYFQTKEEAQAHVNYLKAIAVVRDDAKGFEPDWSDNEQPKFYVCYLPEIEWLSINETWQSADNGVFGLPYFETREGAQASIDKHKKEWETIFSIKNKEGE